MGTACFKDSVPMKHKLYPFLLFFLFALTSCVTTDDVLSFSGKNGATLFYITPVSYKKKPVLQLELDITASFVGGHLEQDASVKYTLSVQGKSRTETENLSLSFIIGNRQINLTKNSVIYAEVGQGNAVKMRFEASLSKEDFLFLLRSNTEPLAIAVLDTDGTYICTPFSGDSLQKKLENLSLLVD